MPLPWLYADTMEAWHSRGRATLAAAMRGLVEQVRRKIHPLEADSLGWSDSRGSHQNIPATQSTQQG